MLPLLYGLDREAAYKDFLEAVQLRLGWKPSEDHTLRFA